MRTDDGTVERIMLCRGAGQRKSARVCVCVCVCGNWYMCMHMHMYMYMCMYVVTSEQLAQNLIGP